MSTMTLAEAIIKRREEDRELNPEMERCFWFISICYSGKDLKNYLVDELDSVGDCVKDYSKGKERGYFTFYYQKVAYERLEQIIKENNILSTQVYMD